MFIVSVIEDRLKIPPEKFSRDHKEVLIEQIDIKYANRILEHVGFCIAFYDFVSIDDPYVYPAEGCVHQLVRFRMVVFRPFEGEVLVGKISSFSKNGVRISMDFFDDIFIPSSCLNTPCEYDENTQSWLWIYEEGSPFRYELHDEFRFRVKRVDFLSSSQLDKTLSAPPVEINVSQRHGTSADEGAAASRCDWSLSAQRSEEGLKPSAMQIIGLSNETGLGVTSWWD